MRICLSCQGKHTVCFDVSIVSVYGVLIISVFADQADGRWQHFHPRGERRWL